MLGYRFFKETGNFIEYIKFFRFCGQPATTKFWNLRNANYNE